MFSGLAFALNSPAAIAVTAALSRLLSFIHPSTVLMGMSNVVLHLGQVVFIGFPLATGMHNMAVVGAGLIFLFYPVDVRVGLVCSNRGWWYPPAD